VIRGVLESARRHGLAVEELDARAVEARFPGFRVPAGSGAVFERQAGWLAVEECVRAHAAEAVELGAEVRAGESVIDWRPEGSGVAVRTDRGTYRAARLVIAAGAWAAGAEGVLGEPGARLRVKRKPVFWYRPGDACYREENGCPAYLYETPAGLFYGIPAGPGGEFKVAQHTGGDFIEDPLAVDRSLRAEDRARVEDFLGTHLPRALGEFAGHSVCLYTMSPDEHFVLGIHPACPAVAFAAGLSGHGFKFTAVLGEVLAELALDGRSRLPIAFLAPGRCLA
jgi:glycine/D-amino acid oxidase-like deaminating enzyme